MPLEHEKKCVDVSSPRCTGMHYVTHRSHRMQKHKFGVTSPDSLFMETTPSLPEHENSVLLFRVLDTLECTT
jgi:hypothetical protein